MLKKIVLVTLMILGLAGSGMAQLRFASATCQSTSAEAYRLGMTVEKKRIAQAAEIAAWDANPTLREFRDAAGKSVVLDAPTLVEVAAAERAAQVATKICAEEKKKADEAYEKKTLRLINEWIAKTTELAAALCRDDTYNLGCNNLLEIVDNLKKTINSKENSGN